MYTAEEFIDLWNACTTLEQFLMVSKMKESTARARYARYKRHYGQKMRPLIEPRSPIGRASAAPDIPEGVNAEVLAVLVEARAVADRQIAAAREVADSLARRGETRVVMLHHKCQRCGGSWLARTVDPKRCTVCTSPLWNTPRTRERKPKFRAKQRAHRTGRGPRT